jgi:hypothetical protein
MQDKGKNRARLNEGNGAMYDKGKNSEFFGYFYQISIHRDTDIFLFHWS